MAPTSEVTVRRIAPQRLRTSLTKVSTKDLKMAHAGAIEMGDWIVRIPRKDGGPITTNRGAITDELHRRAEEPVASAQQEWDFWSRDEAAGLEWDD